LTEEGTVTRQGKGETTTEWMQALLDEPEDLLAEVVRVGLEALMEAERDGYVGAGRYERNGSRRTRRNGYKPRTLRTRVGTLELRVPQTRDGRFYPSMLERYQRSEQALIWTLAECYVQGVSTRKVASICRELFGDEVSHETVSRYAKRLDEELEPWRTRKLEGRYPYLFLDARYEKVRENQRVVDMAVLVGIGVNEEGRREVVGTEVAHGESKATWGGFLKGLVDRGLTGVELVVSDAHAGLGDARKEHLTGVPWQRCQRHFLMNAMDQVPKAEEKALHQALRRVWDFSTSWEQARSAMTELAASLEPRHPRLAQWLEVEGEETLTCFHFPAPHRKRLRTTNGVERVNQELKRRSRVVRIFPNRESCRRLAAALLKEWHEDWITGRRYLRMEARAPRPGEKDESAKLPGIAA
jgi:putative transposase